MIGIVHPGDTLILAISKAMSEADGIRYRENTEILLPGVRVVILAPVAEMAIYRQREEPAEQQVLAHLPPHAPKPA